MHYLVTADSPISTYVVVWCSGHRRHFMLFVLQVCIHGKMQYNRRFCILLPAAKAEAADLFCGGLCGEALLQQLQLL